MIINRDTCIECEKCVEYCPVGAIKIVDEKAIVDQDLCTECGICFRSQVCPVDATIIRVEYVWPRTIRNIFSDPVSVFEETGIAGRGTEESKTNDVTNRFKKGEVGFAVDVGRPNVGTRLKEVEKICMELAKLDPEWEPMNPLTYLMTDKKTGRLKEEALNENVLSAIIEFKTPLEKCVQVVKTLEEASRKINTVFSLGVISRVDDDQTIEAAKVLREAGIPIRPNGKTTLNLGRA